MFKPLLSSALAFIVLSAMAQDVKYEKYTLPNGMKVILHEDHSLPVATINTWFYVGSKDEPPRRSGFAHLFEHLMFMGTERVPGNQFDVIMESGGGNNNASTTTDRTNYYSFGPSALLPTLLWLDADRLEDFGRMMDQKKLDLQREVVKNERRENYENAPYGKVFLAIDKAMYPDGHPYQIDTIGLPEDLDAAQVGDVKEFFKTFYEPNNASLVVAGDFNPAQIKPLIASLFGTLPRADDPIHKSAPPVELHEVKRLTLSDRVQAPRTYMVWHSPAYYKPGDAQADLMAGILTNGFSSRLYQRLVVKDQLASDVGAFQSSSYLQSLFVIQATAKEGVSQDKLEAAIDDELDKFRKSGPTSDELSRQKAQRETQALNGLQSLEGIADKLNEYEFYVGEPNSFKWDLDRYRNMTTADVKTWANKILHPNGRLILRVVPQNQVPEQNPRNTRPAPAAEGTFRLPSPTEMSLSNGIKVFYWQRDQLPLMTLSMLLKNGAANDPPGKSGLANATADMLSQGAGKLDVEAFSNALDALGASFGASPSQTFTTVGLNVLSSNFDKALPLYADAVMRPQLKAEDWKREQELFIDSFKQDADDPGTVARAVAMREFFGPDNPYGRRVSGETASVSKITIDDIKGEHRALFNPANATFFAAGSLPAEQVKASLEKEFGAWKGGTPLPRQTYPAPATQNLKVVIVDKPDAVQTVIRFVMPGYKYGDPNRISLEALGTILGGTFTSRLNQNLREAHGYTYGAGSSFNFEPDLGYFVASSSVRADVTGESLKEFLAEFKKIRGGDISEDEALKARTSLRTDEVTSISSLGGVVSAAEMMYLNGRSLADVSADLDAMSKLNAGQINPLANGSIALEKGVLVLVGDKAQIMKQITGLGLPAPVVVEGIK